MLRTQNVTELLSTVSASILMCIIFRAASAGVERCLEDLAVV